MISVHQNIKETGIVVRHLHFKYEAKQTWVTIWIYLKMKYSLLTWHDGHTHRKDQRTSSPEFGHDILQVSFTDMKNVCSKWCKTHVVTISRRRRGVILFLLLLWSLQQLTE